MLKNFWKPKANQKNMQLKLNKIIKMTHKNNDFYAMQIFFFYPYNNTIYVLDRSWKLR